MIDEVISQHGSKTAGQLSEYSHGDMPWMSAADGETLNYEMWFFTELLTIQYESIHLMAEPVLIFSQTDEFEKDLKRFAKKYRSLPDDLNTFKNAL